MLIDRFHMDEALSRFEERAAASCDAPNVIYAISIALRYGDARDIEASVAMARLLREAARTVQLNG